MNTHFLCRRVPQKSAKDSLEKMTYYMEFLRFTIFTFLLPFLEFAFGLNDRSVSYVTIKCLFSWVQFHHLKWALYTYILLFSNRNLMNFRIYLKYVLNINHSSFFTKVKQHSSLHLFSKNLFSILSSHSSQQP